MSSIREAPFNCTCKSVVEREAALDQDGLVNWCGSAGPDRVVCQAEGADIGRKTGRSSVRRCKSRDGVRVDCRRRYTEAAYPRLVAVAAVSLKNLASRRCSLSTSM